MKKFLFLCALFTLFFVFVSLSAFSEVNPADKALSEFLYEKDPALAGKESKKPFLSTISLGHINGFINSADRINRLSLTGSYRFLEVWSLSVSQIINQHYFLNPNSKDKGIWIQDATLSFQRQFKNHLRKDSFTAGLSSTLPFSHYSQVNDIQTVSTAYLIWSLKLDSFLKSYKPEWIKNISFSVKPIARYYFSEYTTTPTKRQSLGGTPLPQFLIGIQNMGLKAHVTDRVSLSGNYGRWIVSTYTIGKPKNYNGKNNYNEKSRNYDGKSKNYDGKNNYKKYLGHFYLLSFALNFKIHKQWDLSFSYSHIAQMNKQGQVRVFLLDDRLSTWSIAAAYSLSFDFPKGFSP